MALSVGDGVNQDAARYYPEPKDAASNIKGRIVFWRGVEVSERHDQCYSLTGTQMKWIALWQHPSKCCQGPLFYGKLLFIKNINNHQPFKTSRCREEHY